MTGTNQHATDDVSATKKPSAALRPPGGPPSEGVDSVRGARVGKSRRTEGPGLGTVRIEELDISPAPYSGGGSMGDPCQRHVACCPTEGEQGTRIVQATTAARTHSAADPATGVVLCRVKYSNRAPLWTGLPAWGNLSGSPTYTLPLGTGRRSGKGLRTLCQDEAGPLPVVAQARPGARP